MSTVFEREQNVHVKVNYLFKRKQYIQTTSWSLQSEIASQAFV